MCWPHERCIAASAGPPARRGPRDGPDLAGHARALPRHRADADSAGQLLRLADERHERDVARRDAAEEEREAELQRTLAPITATLSHLERSLARSEAARVEAEGALRAHLGQLAQRARS